MVRIKGYGVTQRVTRVNSKEILRENLFTYPLKPGRVHGLNEGQQQEADALLPPKERRRKQQERVPSERAERVVQPEFLLTRPNPPP